MSNEQQAVETNAAGVMSNFSGLLSPLKLRQMAADWLAEDLPAFDYGGYVVEEKVQSAVLLCKSPGVLAGVPFFDAVFSELNCEVKWSITEGEYVRPVCEVATVTGKVRNILLGERVALNCLTRASGIATGARRLRRLVDEQGWHGEVAGTRKTTPGFRLVEKYSLLVGGMSTHRHDLSSMVMIKDNHVWSAGSIAQAVRDARKACGFALKIEVECRSADDACVAADAGADVVMLDNFQPQALHEAARMIKGRYRNVLVEASGGVGEHNVVEFFGPDVDVVSLGSATQGHAVVDFSLKIRAPGRDPVNPTVTSRHAPLTDA